MGKTFICINIDETLQANLASLDCDIVNAPSCQEAKSLMSQVSPDLVIIAADKEQPTMDLTPIKDLKTTAETACLPVLFVTQKKDKLLQKKILEAGVNDFIEVPVDFEELKLRIKNYARISERRNAVMTENQTLKKELSLKNSEIKTSNYTIKEAYSEVIMKLSLAAEYKDPETGDHIKRVAYYCKELANFLGFDESYQDGIFFASPMHDIGKIGIPDNILLKQGGLNESEWEVMKTHTEIGYAILKEPKDSTLAMAQDIALYHHEKFDGTGYPKGLKGSQIPVSARIMAISDVYDALRSDRPYKKGFSHKETLKIMTKGDSRVNGGHFDPEILNVFLRYNDIFEDIYTRGEI